MTGDSTQVQLKSHFKLVCVSKLLELSFREHSGFPKGTFCVSGGNRSCSKWECLMFPAHVSSLGSYQNNNSSKKRLHMVLLINIIFLIQSTIQFQITFTFCVVCSRSSCVRHRVTSGIMSDHTQAGIGE